MVTWGFRRSKFERGASWDKGWSRLTNPSYLQCVQKNERTTWKQKYILYINLYIYIDQGCPNDPLENQMMKPNSESHKQNQTNKWWQSAGFLFRTQIGLPLLTIEFLLVRSPKGALQRWRLGWSDKFTGFPRDETLFAVVFLLSKLCFICIRLISKRIV